MDYSGKFKEDMQKSVLKEIVSLLLKVSALFTIVLLLATVVKNERAVNQNMNHIEQVFLEVYESNKAFLLDEDNVEMFRGVIDGSRLLNEFHNALNRFNMNKEIRSGAIIVGADWNVKYSSYHGDVITGYLYSYNSAVSYNARHISADTVYTAVYNDGDGYFDYMMVSPIMDENSKIMGYISMFISGDDWSYYMSYYNYDAVITDVRDNIIFYNKPNLIESSYKFPEIRSKYVHFNGERYWLKRELLQHYGVKIYSFVLYPENIEIGAGLIAIMIIGILWYRLAKQMAETMADKNAQSISKLLGEIRIIRKYNQKHRISMDTEDEFEDVGHHINYMLDTITDLNGKNTELLKLNNQIEINHLTAQINPHFLYNTLEIIRNLVIYDKDKAGELIIKLTQVLRYSINNSKRDVTLDEDMEFIQDYLSIQKSRFGERFDCQIEISEECNSCTVPKLVLQPIIENSIKYGFRAQMELKIKIAGYKENGFLYLVVEDNGPGIKEDELMELRKALYSEVNETKSNGLFNISRRLKLRYTNLSGIEVCSENKGVKVTLIILQNQEDDRMQHGGEEYV